MTKKQIYAAVNNANIKGEGWYPGPNTSKTTKRLMAEMERDGFLRFESGYGWRIGSKKPKAKDVATHWLISNGTIGIPTVAIVVDMPQAIDAAVRFLARRDAIAVDEVCINPMLPRVMGVAKTANRKK